ncbi:NAD kinase [Haloflavibacter putidus]|uniref:NAD kinase n=1 Tax=Haloflavibacter putidus TaxID=2576776 RepID=A0A507ZSX9_9FLAO|nr:NAD kinase [Haloflavibacter putidus]TQD39651.1 NAD kinase [Haloflavibacter putidus]
MKVAIYGQFYHENSGKYIEELLELLDKEGFEVVIEEKFLSIINQHETITKDYNNWATFNALDNSFNLLFSLGGDGTILKSIDYIKKLDIPIVGINTGRLGFLATIQKEEIQECVQAILEGKYIISERELLDVATSPQNQSLSQTSYALNEVAINRKNSTSMITIHTWLNQKYLTSYWADGLIVSTPTGSTGYSLSCGGPIISPETKSSLITPIAPHNLNARPLIIPDDTEIKLQVTGRLEDFLVSLDSRVTSLHKDTIITIKKAAFKIGLVILEDDSFIKTLRKKLLWGEDRRNKKQ